MILPEDTHLCPDSLKALAIEEETARSKLASSNTITADLLPISQEQVLCQL